MEGKDKTARTRKGEKIMEDKKVLKDEELEKVNGGWTHDIYRSCLNKIGHEIPLT